MAATPEQIDAALATVRAELAALHELGTERDGLVRRAAINRPRVLELRDQIAAQRAAYLAARADAAALIAEP